MGEGEKVDPNDYLITVAQLGEIIKEGQKVFGPGGSQRMNDEHVGSEALHGKKIEVSSVPSPYNPDGPTEIMVKVDGELVPYQRRVLVDSGMDETTIEIELLHPPTLGNIHITGYLIHEEDWRLLQLAKEKGFRG